MINTTHLYYQTSGVGPQLILLHGWGFNSTIWQLLLPELKKHFRVTIVDLPGYGYSKKIKSPYHLEELAIEIQALIHKQAIVVGWSLGGLIATYIAYLFPKKITQLINIASTPCFISNDTWPGIKKEALQALENDLHINHKKTFRRFILTHFENSSSSDHYQIMKEILSNNIPDYDTLKNSLRLLAQTDLRKIINKIQCPQHYIFGTHDTIVPHDTSKKIQSIAPRVTTMTIDQAGHIPFSSHPSICLNHLKINTYEV